MTFRKARFGRKLTSMKQILNLNSTRLGNHLPASSKPEQEHWLPAVARSEDHVGFFHRQRVTFGLLAFACLAMPARAQAPYPTRAITLVVPFAAGGTVDMVGTIIGQRNLRAFPEVTAEKVRLVIDQAAACPAIAEFSVHHFTEAPLDTNASLTSYKTATASNVHSNDTNFGADKAVDDDTDTRWATDDSVGECWLEVDLDKAETFSRMTLNEQEKRIGQFTLEYRNQPDQAWEVAFTGTNVGAKFQTHFPPTTARWVRLHILKASAAPSVSEFNLYKN